jgi:hypothetical protein
MRPCPRARPCEEAKEGEEPEGNKGWLACPKLGTLTLFSLFLFCRFAFPKFFQNPDTKRGLLHTRFSSARLRPLPPLREGHRTRYPSRAPRFAQVSGTCRRSAFHEIGSERAWAGRWLRVRPVDFRVFRTTIDLVAHVSHCSPSHADPPVFPFPPNRSTPPTMVYSRTEHTPLLKDEGACHAVFY